MNVSNLYQKYNIPKHLQKHMLRVASVGKYLVSNSSSQANINSVVTVLLLHDLGNLMKFDLTKGLDLFDDSEKDLKHWVKIKNELSEKYLNEHEATLSMAREIGSDSRILYLLENIGSSNLGRTLKNDDLELKICSYSDFRVTPFGFTTVKERFEDILDRYSGRDHVLADEEKTKNKMQQCIQLENQLETILEISLDEIPEKELEKDSELLRMYEV